MTKAHAIGNPVIELCSGDQLDLANPDPKVITNQVVAHHLANVCRYAGAVRRPYSVGEHTLLVAAWLEDKGCVPEIILGGLHHDDPEAFLGDVTRPLKERLPDYRKVEKEFGPVVAKALEYSRWGNIVEDELVKQADHWAMAAEAYYLMPTRGREWWSWGLYQPGGGEDSLLEVQRLRMTNVPHGVVRNLWMRKHMELITKVQSNQEKMKAAASG